MSNTTCPRCGAAATGKFCSSCGAPLTPRPCPACGATLTPGGAFCHKCGAPASGVAAQAPTAPPPPPGYAPMPVPQGVSANRTPWLIAGTLAFIALVAVVYAARHRGPESGPLMANAGNAGSGLAGTPPDLTQMSLREQFTRLADRIQTAMESGDTAQVVQFFPMLEGAFAQLPAGDRDVDARFHMGLLRAQIGHFSDALAQADTIQAESPTNLFIYYLRAMVAEYQNDTAAAKAARADFAKHFDAEMKAARPEYSVHKEMLEAFLKSPGTS